MSEMSRRDVGESLEREMEVMGLTAREREKDVMGITARERVLGDPDMLDIIFSYLDEQSISRVGLVSRYVRN